MPLRAILFDFDGVIADSEPIHYEGFRRVAAAHGVELGEADYYRNLVGYDDRDAFRHILGRGGQSTPEGEALRALVDEKAAVVERLLRESLEPRPGIRSFVERAAPSLWMGVCSGALRHEVRLGIQGAGIDRHMRAVVAAEDVARGKPEPEGYDRLRRELSEHAHGAGEAPLEPAECVVLEDTSHGLQAGRAAGGYTVGLVGSEPRERLAAHADLVLDSLEGLDPDELAKRLGAGG